MTGFERFLLGPSQSEMQALTVDSPLVVLNVSDIRSDAFLVRTENILLLPLPSLKYKDLESNARLLIQFGRV